ncbi:MAG: hypothetical protein EZS28_022272, partial [Streblomastix strix]
HGGQGGLGPLGRGFEGRQLPKHGQRRCDPLSRLDNEQYIWTAPQGFNSATLIVTIISAPNDFYNQGSIHQCDNQQFIDENGYNVNDNNRFISLSSLENNFWFWQNPILKPYIV